VSDGTTLKDVGGPSGTSCDSLDRPTSQTEIVSGITHTWSYPQNAAIGVQETLAYDVTPLTSPSITRNGRGMATGRTATIAPRTTVTRSVSDPAGRDTADRWTTATIQQSGHTAKTMSRSFDTAGNPFAAYRYDAWGSPQGEGTYATGIWTQSTSLVSSTLAGQIASRQVLRYAGYPYDGESGLYYCSARYYDPATRQWTTGDPAKADGEESAWQYCAGDPVGSVDPSGELRTPLVFNWYHSQFTEYLKRVLRRDSLWAVYIGLAASIDAEASYGMWDFKIGRLNVTPRMFSTPVPSGTYSRKFQVGKSAKTYTAKYGGSREINSDDFGNIHFGYIGPGLGISLSAEIEISYNDAPNLDTDAGRKKETHDEAMIKWGYKLCSNWGMAPWTGYYYTRKQGVSN